MVLAPLMATAARPTADKYKHAVRMLALGNAVPFVGPLTIDAEIKKFLFCPGGNCPVPAYPAGRLSMAGARADLVSITSCFSSASRLRNYFRIK